MPRNGEMVDIYEDPVTKTRLEGKAKLIRKLFEIRPGEEYWDVKFPGDTRLVQRIITTK